MTTEPVTAAVLSEALREASAIIETLNIVFGPLTNTMKKQSRWQSIIDRYDAQVTEEGRRNSEPGTEGGDCRGEGNDGQRGANCEGGAPTLGGR